MRARTGFGIGFDGTLVVALGVGELSHPVAQRTQVDERASRARIRRYGFLVRGDHLLGRSSGLFELQAVLKMGLGLSLL